MAMSAVKGRGILLIRVLESQTKDFLFPYIITKKTLNSIIIGFSKMEKYDFR